MADSFAQDLKQIEEACAKLKEMLDDIASIRAKNPDQSIARQQYQASSLNRSVMNQLNELERIKNIYEDPTSTLHNLSRRGKE